MRSFLEYLAAFLVFCAAGAVAIAVLVAIGAEPNAFGAMNILVFAVYCEWRFLEWMWG